MPITHKTLKIIMQQEKQAAFQLAQQRLSIRKIEDLIKQNEQALQRNDQQIQQRIQSGASVPRLSLESLIHTRVLIDEHTQRINSLKRNLSSQLAQTETLADTYRTLHCRRSGIEKLLQRKSEAEQTEQLRREQNEIDESTQQKQSTSVP